MASLSSQLPLQPPPRRSHCAATVGKELFLWGGRTEDFLKTRIAGDGVLSHMYSFDPLLEAWRRDSATGDLPPGVFNGACAASGGELYYYGGWSGYRPFSALSKFTPSTHTWAILSKNSTKGPMAKIGCGMISCCKNLLCVFAGAGHPEGLAQRGSSLTNNGYTNEIHFFDTRQGDWSSPTIGGTQPCPRAFFSFTAINDHQAVAFAGSDDLQRPLNDCFLIDFRKMEWSELDSKGEVPEPRWAHAACCLNFGDVNPQLLVTGGRNKSDDLLRDAWILDICTKIWRKVDLPSDFLPRADHSLTAIPLAEGVTKVVSFGGWCEWPEAFWSYTDLEPVDETTLMHFEARPSPPSEADSPSKWTLTNVVNNQQREEGLQDKITLLRAVEKADSTIDLSILQQFHRALAKGFIRSRVTTCVALGAPGSGKTHLRHFLYNQPPPQDRVSTACIEQPQRAVLSSHASDPATFSCTPMDSTMVKVMTAENVKTGVQEAKAPAIIHSPTPFISELASTQVKDSFDFDQIPSQKPTSTLQGSLRLPSEPAASRLPPTATPTTQAPLSSTELVPHPPPTRLPGTADILELMKSTSGRECALEVHTVHFIDSGGQPQYLDMAPPFLHGVSIILSVTKLNERLSDTPNVEYCNSDLMYDLGEFDVSNENMIVRAAQLTLFHKPQLALPCVSSQPTEPVCAVVGTFVDKEHECDESRVEKNMRLEVLLKPFSSKLIRRSSGDVIFPINGTTSGQQTEQPIASDLRLAISLAPSLELDMPLQWQLLLVELGDLEVQVVLRSHVNLIAAKLCFESLEAVEAALRYIDLAHLFIYVPEVLPNVVIIEPDAIHSKSTQLLEEHIKLSAADDADIQNNEQLQFRNQAIFTSKILNDLPSKYDKEVLPDDSLACLLQYKLLLTEVALGCSHTCYFMPSLLPTLSELTLPDERAADPLIVSFPFEMAPSGLLPATVVQLLTSKHWRLYETQKQSLNKLYKNHLELTVANYPGTITLASNSRDFAVCASSSFPAVKLPQVYKDVSNALDIVCERFSFNKLHKFGFRCQCGESPPHSAVLSSSDLAVTTCSRDPKHGGLLTPKQELWVPELECTVEDVCTQCVPEVKDESSQTEPQLSADVLGGVNVLAETEFTYTGAAESFEWSGHGFRLHFPGSVLPRDMSACVLNVKAAISGQFQLPKDTELVSGIYCISSPCKFTENVTIDIQHCLKLASHDICRLSFIRADCYNVGPPYCFKFLDGGVFSNRDTYGSIELSHFSLLGVVYWLFGFGPQREPDSSDSENSGHVSSQPARSDPQITYCSQLYYKERHLSAYKVNFVIIRNLELHVKAVADRNSEAIAGPCQKVDFEEDEIKLNVPPEGATVGTGGSVFPLTHPGVLKDEVDNFLPGQMIPSCELLVNRHLGSKVEVLRAELVGAKSPHNFFCIECHPAIAVTTKGADSIKPTPSPSSAWVSLKPQELEVKNTISSVNRWFELGEQLGLAYDVLEAIEVHDSIHGISRQRSKMVNTWLKSDPAASWSKLCGALERVGERALAQDITEKHQ